MSGKIHKRKRKHPKDAPPAPDRAPPDPALLQEIRTAELEHRRLINTDDESFEHLRRVHLAGARVWKLRADMEFAAGDHDAARKAASSANEDARQAERLAQNSLLDRLAALEAEVAKRRAFGSGLAVLKQHEQ